MREGGADDAVAALLEVTFVGVTFVGIAFAIAVFPPPAFEAGDDAPEAFLGDRADFIALRTLQR
jgi:hypothetical protein